MAKPSTAGLHLIAKPIGPVCNLNCVYCFYLEKKALFPPAENYRMSDEVLQAYVRSYLAAQPYPEVEFVWQGGEPTMLGLDFFRRALELQQKHKKDKKVSNCLQTNGVLLNDEWCEFLKKHDFLVGISLDGPEEVHDFYRVNRSRARTFGSVMNGLNLLKKHGVRFNVLACVASETASEPLKTYRFLKENGVGFIQFTPVVERDKEGKLLPWTVEPVAYGDFLSAIFDEWVRQDVGMVFVMNFEWAVNAWVGNPSPVCIFAESCGRSLVIEHNGDVYACDHFVYPPYRLGNVLKDDLGDLARLPAQLSFGAAKAALPDYCRSCQFLFACRGECPKRRFARTPYGGPGLNYLCPGYKKYFQHITKYLNALRQILEKGLPASDIMKAVQGPLVVKLPAEGGNDEN